MLREQECYIKHLCHIKCTKNSKYLAKGILMSETNQVSYMPLCVQLCWARFFSPTSAFGSPYTLVEWNFSGIYFFMEIYIFNSLYILNPIRLKACQEKESSLFSVLLIANHSSVFSSWHNLHKIIEELN